MVDAVLVINLDQRPDRWEQFLEDAHDVIPKEKLHRVSAMWGRDLPGFGERPWFRGRKRDAAWAGKAGCTLSHRCALLAARESGWNTVLILEDDAVFQPAFSAVGAGLRDALERHANEWDVCYLGFTDPRRPYRLIEDLGSGHGLHQIFGCNTTHAYLVKPQMREWMLEGLPDESQIWHWLTSNRTVDRWYQRTLGLRFRVACVSPCVVDQRVGFSDIVGQEMDYGDDHQVTVPVCHPGATVFRTRLTIERMYSRAQQCYDWSRGVVKRLRGL